MGNERQETRWGFPSWWLRRVAGSLRWFRRVRGQQQVPGRPQGHRVTAPLGRGQAPFEWWDVRRWEAVIRWEAGLRSVAALGVRIRTWRFAIELVPRELPAGLRLERSVILELGPGLVGPRTSCVLALNVAVGDTPAALGFPAFSRFHAIIVGKVGTRGFGFGQVGPSRVSGRQRGRWARPVR
jgi:hypothetical protein